MPFRVFAMKGGGASPQSNYPFKAIIGSSTSGIGVGNINAKCSCDTENPNSTSSSFFTYSPGQVVPSGRSAVKIFSGSMLYKSMDMDQAKITSYADNPSVIDTEDEKDYSVMRVFGLNSPIFIEDFIPVGSPNATLKIWLTVCYPSGQPESEGEATMDAADPNDFTIHGCQERSNKPLGAFISCSTGAFPKAAVTRLINKGTPSQPRYEKRQISANIPIAEISRSGTVVRQLLNSNLCLVDMNIQGFPCKMPLSLFSEST